MGKLEEALRSTVLRLIRRELRASVVPLSREVRQLRLTVSPLRKTVSALEKLAAEQVRRAQAETAQLQASGEETRQARLSPTLISSLRARLGITQGQLASLVGVSAGAVGGWEKGRMAPQGRNRMALVALRKLRRAEVKQLLTERGADPARKETAKARSRKGKRKSR
jgi:DNA-binding transcriptional regulator YiaG